MCECVCCVCMCVCVCVHLSVPRHHDTPNELEFFFFKSVHAPHCQLLTFRLGLHDGGDKTKKQSIPH